MKIYGINHSHNYDRLFWIWCWIVDVGFDNIVAALSTALSPVKCSPRVWVAHHCLRRHTACQSVSCTYHFTNKTQCLVQEFVHPFGKL